MEAKAQITHTLETRDDTRVVRSGRIVQSLHAKRLEGLCVRRSSSGGKGREGRPHDRHNRFVFPDWRSHARVREELAWARGKELI
jgi:hypothetical protein